MPDRYDTTDDAPLIVGALVGLRVRKGIKKMSGPMAFYDENTFVPLTAGALEMLRRQDVGGDGLGGDDDGDDDRDYG